MNSIEIGDMFRHPWGRGRRLGIYILILSDTQYVVFNRMGSRKPVYAERYPEQNARLDKWIKL
jgi:hypothetical protein